MVMKQQVRQPNRFHAYAFTVVLIVLLNIQNGKAAAQYGGTETYP